MSDAIVKHLPYAVDLNAPIKKTYVETLLATEDNLAHSFDISLVRGNEAVSIPDGSSVTAHFIRYSDNATIYLTATADGNTASVVLTKPCYNKAGQFAIIVKVAADDVIQTVFYAEGTIYHSSTDTILDEENVVPSIDDLLAQIAVMEQGTQEAQEAADNANNAANNANEAAAQFDGMTVSATASETANAVISEQDGVKHIAFFLPQGPQGPKGADGTMTFADLTAEQRESLRGPAGVDGEDGYTPVKGVDYWTDADKAEMVNDVLAALPNASGVNF